MKRAREAALLAISMDQDGEARHPSESLRTDAENWPQPYDDVTRASVRQLAADLKAHEERQRRRDRAIRIAIVIASVLAGAALRIFLS